MNELSILKMINNFPIGGEPTTRNELLSKVSIISYLAKYQDELDMIDDTHIREEMTKNFLSKVVMLEKNEIIPNISLAEKILKLSNDFIEDYNKVQMIKDNNDTFSDIYREVAKVIKQTLSLYSRSTR